MYTDDTDYRVRTYIQDGDDRSSRERSGDRRSGTSDDRRYSTYMKRIEFKRTKFTNERYRGEYCMKLWTRRGERNGESDDDTGERIYESI